MEYKITYSNIFLKFKTTHLNNRKYPSESPLMRRSCAAERLAAVISDVMG